MISIHSQQDAILLGFVGLFLLMLCGAGMILTLRRGWFKPRYRDVKITERENPRQFSFVLVGYLLGIVMGLILLSQAIFWSPL